MAEEKIYTIPLGEAYKKARQKRTPYAARLVRSFIKTHTKAATVKLGTHLNEHLWARSIKKPPRRVRVKVVKDGDIAKAELVGFEYIEFKAQPKQEKKGMRERLAERLGPKAQKQEELEKQIEGKKEEKAEAGEKEAKPVPAAEKKEETK